LYGFEVATERSEPRPIQARFHLSRVSHQVNAVLEQYGHRVTMLVESRVGYRIYEDTFQVIAEPFSDTQTG